MGLSCDVVVIGGGIIGLSTAMTLARQHPGAGIVVVEKESGPCLHQTGRNSGVIHSGIYYRPGSFKARFCRAGSRSIVEFAEEHGVAYDICGKVIVATRKEELGPLDALSERGLENGLDVERLGPAGVRDIEPNVNCVGGIRVPTTGIIDFVGIADAYASVLTAAGGTIRFDTEVYATVEHGSGHTVVTSRGDIEAGFVVNCAGLQADRLARTAGSHPEARIVPFRGEYFELVPEACGLVNTLIYPVPNPEFPFLGVHLTKGLDGGVHAGPNAVPALAREGYRWSDVNVGDVAETLGYPGFWRLAAKHWREGTCEIIRSLSRTQFVRTLQQLVPAIGPDDVEPAPAGVRAQALSSDGSLVDDFLIVEGRRSLHVCNAPSPAATSSLEIGREIAARVQLTT